MQIFASGLESMNFHAAAKQIVQYISYDLLSVKRAAV